MVPTTTVAASLQGRYEGESSLDFSRSLTLLTVSNRRNVSPTLNRVAIHWAVTEEMSITAPNPGLDNAMTDLWDVWSGVPEIPRWPGPLAGWPAPSDSPWPPVSSPDWSPWPPGGRCPASAATRTRELASGRQGGWSGPPRPGWGSASYPQSSCVMSDESPLYCLVFSSVFKSICNKHKSHFMIYFPGVLWFNTASRNLFLYSFTSLYETEWAAGFVTLKVRFSSVCFKILGGIEAKIQCLNLLLSIFVLCFFSITGLCNGLERYLGWVGC